MISDTLTYPDAFKALETAEPELGRPVKPTVMTPSQWRAKRAPRDSFVARQGKQPRVFVIGSDDDLK